MLKFSFSSKLNWASFIVFIAKLDSKKIRGDDELMMNSFCGMVDR